LGYPFYAPGTIYRQEINNRKDMGKYLHRYETTYPFEGDYNTETQAVVSFGCSSGTFIYDRYELQDGYPVYIYKNGNVELTTPTRSFAVNDSLYDVVNQVEVTVTSIGNTEPAPYHRPWVSYTKDYGISKFNATLSNESLGQTKTDQTYVLEGEVKIGFLK
jgi:hypothetical protein